jgi:hypothetical protein
VALVSRRGYPRFSVAVWPDPPSYWVGVALYRSAGSEFFENTFTDEMLYKNDWKKRLQSLARASGERCGSELRVSDTRKRFHQIRCISRLRADCIDRRPPLQIGKGRSEVRNRLRDLLPRGIIETMRLASARGHIRLRIALVASVRTFINERSF